MDCQFMVVVLHLLSYGEILQVGRSYRMNNVEIKLIMHTLISTAGSANCVCLVFHITTHPHRGLWACTGPGSGQ